ncbi:unnamed protein product [Pleuronectes platessa]|uniref:Uncharacterized protein n=1 Tax=Pleuronectes platessa TaxID=8262 RepID=A0A9N7W4E5_PLEPL|nr:unnamed protein product [Pleuronectes platessa]
MDINSGCRGPTRSHQQEHVGNFQARGGACRAAWVEPVERRRRDMTYKLCCGKIRVVVYSSSTPESALINKRSGMSSCFQVDVFVFYVYELLFFILRCLCSSSFTCVTS